MMMEYLFLFVFGIGTILLGIFNWKGNITSIHWYNRTKVTKDNVKKYGKVMGLGTIIIGSSLSITSILYLLIEKEFVWYVTLVGIVIGLILMIYGQFKYNRGIF